MPTKQIVVERFSVTSARSFADVMSAIDVQVGHPDLRKFLSELRGAKDDREVQRIIAEAVGPDRTDGVYALQSGRRAAA